MCPFSCNASFVLSADTIGWTSELGLSLDEPELCCDVGKRRPALVCDASCEEDVGRGADFDGGVGRGESLGSGFGGSLCRLLVLYKPVRK
jgi:hypothetical protein